MISTAAAAQTTIEFKLTGEVHRSQASTKLDVTSVNQQLKKLKSPQFPEVLVWGKNSQRAWEKLIGGLKTANKALKLDIELIAEQGYFYEFPAICYRGKASEVPEVIESLMGTVFHPDQDISAVKFGAVKIVHNPATFFETNSKRMKLLRRANPKDMKKWFSYSRGSSSVLVLSDFGPQGDGSELIATEISRCK